ncbi:hypothetical protein [Phaeodactylibacter sp.]|jgi:hypothetical protein|uniref:hypothetical protein n=1 Tax=Phaeodactylibacter sp. TaxID=1940289 RepID=UPI0025FA3DAC|nr:hypothetical protein [Phaeodactylibacter sp.]MCI4651170.1 hypothetical protein [Phaeodactylibacter sp.]MCI5090463.1 hypothetical protein [Phaeodactylibacter sp.]
MKKIAFVALIALLAACSNNDEEKKMLLGKWQYDPARMSEEFQKTKPSPQEQVALERFVMMYQNDAFIFEEDGSMLVTTPNGATLNGSWDMSPDAKTLFMNLGSQEIPNKITKLTSEELVLAADTTRRSKYTRILKKVEGPAPAATE